MFPLLPDPTAASAGGTAWRSNPEVAPAIPEHAAFGRTTVPPVLHATPPAPATVTLAPDQALARLLAGNHRFAAGTVRHGHRITAALAAAAEPKPYAVVVGCMDARVAVEAVFDLDFGEVFVVRSAGHVVDRTALASIELAITNFGIGLVLVLGHTRCAAVANAVTMADRRLPGRHVRNLLDEIRQAIPAGAATGGGTGEVVAATTRNHVARTVASLGSLLPPTGTARTPVRVAGALYDVATGRATLL